MYHKNIKLYAVTQRGNNKFLEDLWKDIKNNLILIRGGQFQQPQEVPVQEEN